MTGPDPASLSDAHLFHSLRNNRALARKSGLTPQLEARLAELLPALQAEADRRGLAVPAPRRRSRPRDPRIPQATPPDRLLAALTESVRQARKLP